MRKIPEKDKVKRFDNLQEKVLGGILLKSILCWEELVSYCNSLGLNISSQCPKVFLSEDCLMNFDS